MRVLGLVLLFAASAWCQPDRSLPVGEKIPEFALRDQSDQTRTFKDIRGPKGAMLVFYRSADW